jgi:hypothetical protein
MTLAGVIWLLIRYEVLRLPCISPGSFSCEVAPPETAQGEDDTSG